MKSSVPAAGWTFVLIVLLAPIVLLLGAYFGVKLLLFAGMIAAAFLVLFLLLGAVC